jgi:hypothetical protein
MEMPILYVAGVALAGAALAVAVGDAGLAGVALAGAALAVAVGDAALELHPAINDAATINASRTPTP